MQPPLLLDPILPVLDALADASPAVRRAALHALVRLDLDSQAWDALFAIFQPWLDQAEKETDFDSVTLDGLPLWEILAAALYLPDSKVRDQLRDLSKVKGLPPAQSVRLSSLLIQAGDERTILEAFAALNPNRPTDWGEIAPRLYRLHAWLDPAPLQTAFKASKDPELRFWLALALARQGEAEPLEGLFAASGDDAPLSLEKAWEAFGPFTTRLHPFPAFPSQVQEALYKRYTKRPNTASAELAVLLLKAGMDPDEAATIPTQATPAPPPARWAGRAAAPTQDVSARLADGLPLEPDSSLLAALPNLSTEQATRLVSLAFAGCLPYILKSKYARLKKPGDAYGCYPAEAALQLGEKYIPGLPELFEIFETTLQARPARQGMLADQIAWAASRAGVQAVLASSAPGLYAPQETRRLAALRFIELANLYAVQPQPPGIHAITASQPLPVLSEVPAPAIPELEKAIGGGMDDGGFGMGLDAFGPDASGLVDFAVGAGPAQKPVINTGWAAQASPADRLLPEMPLQAGTDYYFWLNVDLPSRFSGESTPTGIQPEVAAGSLLTVTLVGYQGSFSIDPNACTGELEVLDNGYAKVNRQPLGASAPHTPISSITLYFPVSSPAKPGSYRLRCNIYYGQLLLQSRLATAQVTKNPKPSRTAQPAWRTDLDFHLTSPLLPAGLSDLPEHKLSLQVNANSDGTHSFHFKGAADGKELKQDDVRFGEGEMQAMIGSARQAMQIASWDKAEDWQETWPFKYQDRQRNVERLRLDLVRLARWGYEFYFTVGERLAGGFDALENFEALMKATGYVQIAMKSSPGFILPAALIYDYPLDTSSSKPYTLCPTFQDALLQNRKLEDEPCFNGDCPSRGEDTTVCPGGFWGFRHYLGLPLSLDNSADAPLRIPYAAKPRFLMGEYSDFNLVAGHKDKLDDMALEFSSEADRDVLLERMKQHQSELIYFFCHGGLVRGLPFLVVGSKTQKGQIQPSNFLAKHIRWSDDPHPLVFLNGCHTSAVDPFAALNLLHGFLVHAQAAGVIGTEITIYEELAKDFAEAFFPRLLEGQPVGQALRGARLAILAQGNPLGLVYTPFVQAGLRLESTGAQTGGSGMGDSTGSGMGMGLGLDPASPFGL